MSERSFFNNRYSIPGFHFLIIVIILNLPEIIILNHLKIISITNVIENLIIPIFSIITSIGIGFIVSQVWYVIYGWNVDILYNNGSIRQVEAMIEELHLKCDNPTHHRIIYHYISNKAEKPIDTYLIRRWDLMNILGGSICATILGILIGLIINYFIYYYTIIQFDFLNQYHVCIIVFTVVYIYFLLEGIERILIEHREMTLLISRKMNQWDIPHEYRN